MANIGIIFNVKLLFGSTKFWRSANKIIKYSQNIKSMNCVVNNTRTPLWKHKEIVVWRRILFYKTRKQSTSHDERQLNCGNCSRKVREAVLPATRSQRYLSKSVTRGWNNDIKTGNHEISKFQTLYFTNFKTVLQMCITHLTVTWEYRILTRIRSPVILIIIFIIYTD